MWPAGLLTTAALAAACVVVGEHVVQSSDGCLDSTGWFTATPVAGPADDADAAGKHVVPQDKPASATPRAVPEIIGIADPHDPSSHQISGCLDLDRIEIAPTPAPDGRA